jgi:hypothetical protein
MVDPSLLPFISSISSSLPAVGPVGMWAKASISPLAVFAPEAGKAETVGRADRPHIHRPFLVDLPRRAVAEALVLAFLVLEAEPGTKADLRAGGAGISVQVDLLVFQAAPQPLDEDVVQGPCHPC